MDLRARSCLHGRGQGEGHDRPRVASEHPQPARRCQWPAHGFDLLGPAEVLRADEVRASSRAGGQVGFNTTILEVAISAYQMGRVLTYEGQAVNPLYAANGIIAGDSLSDALVKLYYLDVFDRLAGEHP